MKDLHIVIVSWNVRDEVVECLASLEAGCHGLDWECVVVDNASGDGTVSAINDKFAGEERIDVIANNANRGFSYACNQGAVQHKARHVLLLNPDTRCLPGSLTAMVKFLDEHPGVGVLGPKLLNKDGSYQMSVRRFPGFYDQTLIAIKAHRIFKNAKVLKKYFASDTDTEKSQEVEQVMGACFMVRGEVWDKLGGLDQRYFIWFEEVDFCKRTVGLGYKVWYEPSINVMHASGESFGKAFGITKQRYFNDSLRKYARKWMAPWQYHVVYLLTLFSVAEAAGVSAGRYMFDLSSRGWGLSHPKKIAGHKHAPACLNWSKIFWWRLALIALIELLSLGAFFIGGTQIFMICVVVLAMAYAAYKKPAMALAMVAGELVIGGLGHLFLADVLGFGISFRMAMMAGFFTGWGINAIMNKIWKYWRLRELIIVQVWVFVAMMVVYGIILGLVNDQPYLLNDANAWIFLVYLIPVLDLANRYKSDLKRESVATLMAAMAWLGMESLMIFYVFSHNISHVGDWFYRWIRDTRVGEITVTTGSVRVFLQSMVYGSVAWSLIMSWLISKSKPKGENHNHQFADGIFPLEFCWEIKFAKIIFPLLIAIVLILSLSRSFWLGSAVATMIVVFLAAWESKKFHIEQYLKSILLGIAGFVILGSLLAIPIPTKSNVDLAGMLFKRGQTADASGMSRYQMLPVLWEKIKQQPVLGHGLGSAVTYESNDPRIRQKFPDGKYTTYAFEWGWLGIWIKFGIFGVVIILWLLGSQMWRLHKSNYNSWIKIGLISGLAGLAVTHVFTPYLDHPLGFGVLLAVEAILAANPDINTIGN